MKKIINYLFVFVALALTSCEEEQSNNLGTESPTTGWVEFAGTGTATLTFTTEELVLPVDINVPVYTDGLTVSYTIEAVDGDFNEILTTGSSIFVDPSDTDRSASLMLNFSGIDAISELIVFDVVLTGVSSAGVNVGVGSESVTRYRISTPCPVVLTSTYTGTEVLYNGGPAPSGHTATVTVESAEDNIYSLDTVWGPTFISTLCGGCVPDGEYVGPITFQVNPLTFEITVLAGGEPSGVGLTFDLAYNIVGSGSMDTCNNVITLNLEQDLLTSGGIPGTVDVILTGN
jgi:hypothetical protein